MVRRRAATTGECRSNQYSEPPCEGHASCHETGILFHARRCMRFHGPAHVAGMVASMGFSLFLFMRMSMTIQQNTSVMAANTAHCTQQLALFTW